MPFKCCVPKCNGNYNNGPKVSTFSFPKEENLRQKWLKAICRKNFSPTNNSKVCELHFQNDEIERETRLYSVDGKRLTTPLAHPRLIAGAVPRQLPGCPSYLSKPVITHREDPEQKRQRLECARMEATINNSIERETAYKEKISVHSLDEVKEKLSDIHFENFTVNKKTDKLYFFYIEEEPFPTLKWTVLITENLKLIEYCGETNKQLFHGTVNNMKQIEEILQQVSCKVAAIAETRSLKENIKVITEILELLAIKLPQEKNIMQFLQEQIKLLDCSVKNILRYSWEMMLFCSLCNILLNNYCKKQNDIVKIKTMPQCKRIRRNNPK